MKKLFVTLLFAGFISFIPSSLHSESLRSRYLITSSLSAQIPTDGLVAWYPFNGNANDESGNGNHGVVNGATLTTDRFGNPSKAYNFDGNGNFIQTEFIGPMANSAFSICFWLNTSMSVNTSYNEGVGHIIGWGSEMNGQGYMVTVNGSAHNAGCPQGITIDNYGGAQVKNDYFNNTWEFYVVINDPLVSSNILNQKIYKNGQLLTSHCWDSGNNTPTTNIGSDFPMRVGKYYGSSWVNPYALTGKLDDLGIYSKVLSDQEIQQLYQDQTGQVQQPLTCNITVPTTTLCEGESVTLSVNTTGGSGASSQLPANLQQGLVAYYPFNGNANDESGNGNVLVVNNCQYSIDRHGQPLGSILTQGNNSSYLEVLPSTSLSINEFTWSLWVKFNSNALPPWGSNINPGIISRTDYGTTCHGVTVAEGNSKLGAQSIICNSSVENYGPETNVIVGNDYWHHMVLIVSPGNYTQFYIDGEAQVSVFIPANFTMPFDQPIRLGRPTDLYWKTYDGKFDDIAIYNRALSPSEIQQLYNAQSYAWSNNATTPTITVTPTQNTTYTCTVTQGNSTCTASVEITVNPNVTNAISATIIEGETYTLGAQTLTTPGTYTEVFTSAAGCDSTVTLTLAVEPLLTCEITAPTTTLCEGESVTLSVSTTGGSSYIPTLNIGNVGPGGGLIFYDKGFESSGWRYLEAAPSDIQMSAWGCMDQFVSGGLTSAIGSGMNNTLTIVSQCDDMNTAAARCLNYSVNGKDNWHLPSMDEFNAMHLSLISQGMGGFATEPIPTFGFLYWTSSQFDEVHGWHYFGEEPSLFAAFAKVYNLYVRPVRFVSEAEVTNFSTVWNNSIIVSNAITVSPTQTTTYTATVTTATQTCTDSITITVNPLLTWYADADADGFGNPDDVVQDCNQPLGYIADNTDCNDEDAATYPGADEICDNNRDENCDGVDSLCFVPILGCTDINACNFNPEANTEDGSCILPQPETCNGLDDNCNEQVDEGFTIPSINATSATPALYPTCTGNALKNANLLTGTDSPVIAGSGPDLWYSFTAQYNTLRVGLSAAFGDNSIGLYTNNNGCLELISEEHEVYTATTAATGNQILLTDQLTVGQTYYVAVHQITGPANASAKVCFTYLNESSCDHYYSNNTGIYNNVCNSFKAQYRANATNYLFNVLSGTQNGVNMNLTPWTYTNNNSNSVVARLGSILPANHSGVSRLYTLSVPTVYGLTDAAGNISNLVANATSTCTVTLNSETTITLRQADRCPTNKSLTSTIAPDRTVCGAMRYDWEFTEVLPNPGTAQVVQGGNYTTVFFLSNIPGITAGKTYSVRVRPVHSSGVAGQWGSVQCLRVGAAGMIQQSQSESENVFATNDSRMNGFTDSPIHRFTDSPLSLYPNPTSTGSFVLNYNSSRRGEWTFALDAETEPTFTEELVMMDITGKVVFKTNVVLNGNIAEIHFGDLEAGLYLVDFGGERSRLQVVK